MELSAVHCKFYENLCTMATFIKQQRSASFHPKGDWFCFIPLRNGQLSSPPEWLLFRGLTVIYRKTADFVIMLQLSIKLQLFTKIIIQQQTAI